MKNNYTFWQLIKNHRIEIPVIQRDYAMGRDNIKAQDIRDNFIGQIKKCLSPDENQLHLNFVYGKIKGTRNAIKIAENKETAKSLMHAVKSYTQNLNVDIRFEFKEYKETKGPETVFIPLDGQQRLTTLFLLHWYMLQKFEDKKEGKETLNNFSYRVRPSSKDFCKALIKNDVPIDEDNLSEKIKNADWFFTYWEKDSTVTGMLIMLDVIHENFKDSSDDDFKIYWDTLISKEKISFEFLNLEKLELTDDLYIKMNARGKPLTAFENFKAWLMDFVSEQEIAINIKDWETKLDTTWADLFWENKDHQNYLIDEECMRFFRNMAQIFYVRSEKFKGAGKTDDGKKMRSNASRLATDKGSDREYLYIPNDFYEELKIFTENNLNELFEILELLSDKTIGNNQYSDYIKKIDFFNKDKDKNKRTLFKSFITGEMTYPDKARFYAMVKFLLTFRKENFSEKAFFSWMRVMRNLIENTQIDSIERFGRVIKEIDKLNEGFSTYISNDFYEFIINNQSIKGFYKGQVEEEIAKAKLILDRENLFIEYENHLYFKGQINFLLELSKKENSGEFDEDKFKDYAEKCSIIFKYKLESEDDVSLEQALLTEDDYLIQINSNYSFMRMKTPPGKAKQDWKSKFFRDKDKLKILKAVLENIKSNDLLEELKVLVDQNKNKQNIPEWRKYFLNYEDAITVCGQRLIRWYDDNHIRLLGSSATSHYHVELRSYCFYLEMKRKNGSQPSIIEPFNNIDYHWVRSKSETPCAYIDSWESDANHFYKVKIRYININKENDWLYEIRFFNNNEKIDCIENNVIKVLSDNGMEETDKYGATSYIITKPNGSETLNYLEDLCSKLQKA